MKEFLGRVGQYKIVQETQNVASNAYNLAKERDGLNILSKVEVAASALASAVQPIMQNAVVRKLDEVVCREVLGRVESVYPTLKDKTTEELLGPVANRAIDVAESCANYCLPAEESDAGNVGEAGRLERLSNIRKRVRLQSLSLFNSSLERAHHLLSSMYASSFSATQNLTSSPYVTATLEQVTTILNFASKTAKAVSLPVVVQGLDVLLSQMGKMDHQLKESGNLEWLHLEKIIERLETVRSSVASAETNAFDNQPTNSAPEQTINEEN